MLGLTELMVLVSCLWKHTGYSGHKKPANIHYIFRFSVNDKKNVMFSSDFLHFLLSFSDFLSNFVFPSTYRMVFIVLSHWFMVRPSLWVVRITRRKDFFVLRGKDGPRFFKNRYGPLKRCFKVYDGWLCRDDSATFLLCQCASWCGCGD